MILLAIQVLYPLVLSFPECRTRHCISFWLPISFCEDFIFTHYTTWHLTRKFYSAIYLHFVLSLVWDFGTHENGFC